MDKLDFDLRELNVFAHVVDAGSMTAAAKRLGTTQSAVSQTVGALEHSLGTQLIDRSVRPQALTPAGRLLYLRGAELLKTARSACQEVREAALVAAPRLRIGLVDSLAALAAPHLRLSISDSVDEWDIKTGSSEVNRRDFLSREVDLAVLAVHPDEESAFEVYGLLVEPLILLVPKSYEYDVTSLVELSSRMNMVRFSPQSTLGRQVEQHLTRLRVPWQCKMEFDTPNIAMSMVAAGCGWLVTTPLCLLQGFQYLDRIRCLPLPGPDFQRHLSLVARPGELGHLPRRIADVIANALRTDFLPIVERHATWAIPRVGVAPKSDRRVDSGSLSGATQ